MKFFSKREEGMYSLDAYLSQFVCYVCIQFAYMQYIRNVCLAFFKKPVGVSLCLFTYTISLYLWFAQSSILLFFQISRNCSLCTLVWGCIGASMSMRVCMFVIVFIYEIQHSSLMPKHLFFVVTTDMFHLRGNYNSNNYRSECIRYPYILYLVGVLFVVVVAVVDMYVMFMLLPSLCCVRYCGIVIAVAAGFCCCSCYCDVSASICWVVSARDVFGLFLRH